ncbi:MAG TPA: YetF domain-containing protein [Bryobacteraceae bacterium]|nr:YetF domain-containing protein [Bryobacteraceae bacterium]
MGHLFQFQIPAWELVLRGTFIYWFLFVLFRFALRRDTGSLTLADVLVVVLIADAAQNGMAGEYKSVGEAMVLVGTIAGWNYFIDWMSYRNGAFARFAQPSVVTLVRNGHVLSHNLQQQLITGEELRSQLRLNGVENLADVKWARLEPDGHISVIRHTADVEQREMSGIPGAG